MVEIRKSVWDAYRTGRMDAESRAEFEADYSAGLITIPRETVQDVQLAPEQSLGRSAGIAGRALLKGAADTVGVFSDPLAYVLNKGNEVLGGDPGYFKTASNTVGRAADASGLPKPETEGERIASSATSGATAAGLPVGAARSLARRATDKGAEIIKAISGSPVAQVAGGAAAGVAVDETARSGGGALEQIGAGLAAGVAPSLITAVPALARASLGKLTSSGRNAAAAEKLSEVSGKSQQELSQDLYASKDILPGSQRTTGEATGNAGLLSAERSSPDIGDGSQALLAKRDDARRTALDSIAKAGNIDDLTQAVKSRVDDLDASFADTLSKAQSRVDRRLSDEGRGLSPDVTGDILRADYTAGLSAAKSATREAYDAEILKSLQVEMPVKKIDGIITDMYGDATTLMSEPVRRLVGAIQISAEKGPMSYQTYKAFRSGMSSIAKEAALSGDRQGAALAIRILDEIDQVPANNIAKATNSQRANLALDQVENKKTATLIEESPQGDMARMIERRDTDRRNMGSPARKDLLAKVDRRVYDEKVQGRADDKISLPTLQAQADALEAARRARIAQGDVFEKGPAGELRKLSPDMSPKLQGAEIPAKFLNSSPSSREDAAQFIKTFGKQPEATKAGLNYLVGEMRRVALDADGKVKPARLRQFTEDYKHPLAAFGPANAARFKNIAKAQELADKLTDKVKLVRKEVESGAAGLFLKKTPEAAIADAMNSTNPKAGIRKLYHLVRKDPEAVRGLKRGMIEMLEGRSAQHAVKSINQEGPTLGQASFSKNFDKHADAFSSVMTKEEMDVLRAVKADIESAGKAANVGRGAGSDTAKKLSMITLLRGSVDLGSAALRGLPVLKEIREAILRLPEKQVQDIFNEALLDPAAARMLLQEVSTNNQKSIINMLNIMSRRAGYGAFSSTIAGAGDKKESN